MPKRKLNKDKRFKDIPPKRTELDELVTEVDDIVQRLSTADAHLNSAYRRLERLANVLAAISKELK